MKNPYSIINELKIGEIKDVQNELFKGVMQLCQDKSIYEISIKELIRTSHVGKGTFFSYYSSMDELIEDMENYCVIKLMKRHKCLMETEGSPEGHLLYYKETVDYIDDNRNLFHAFVITDINKRFIDKWKNAIKYQLLERDISISSKEKCDFMLEMAASEMITAYIFWLKNPYEIDFDCLDRVVCETLKIIGF